VIDLGPAKKPENEAAPSVASRINSKISEGEISSSKNSDQVPVKPPLYHAAESIEGADRREEHHHHEEGGDHHHHHEESGDHHHGEGHHGHHGDSHPAIVFETLPADNTGLLATNRFQDQELTDLAQSSNRLAFQVLKYS